MNVYKSFHTLTTVKHNTDKQVFMMNAFMFDNSLQQEYSP